VRTHGFPSKRMDALPEHSWSHSGLLFELSPKKGRAIFGTDEILARDRASRTESPITLYSDSCKSLNSAMVSPIRLIGSNRCA
jgi:hypothetical protein